MIDHFACNDTYIQFLLMAEDNGVKYVKWLLVINRSSFNLFSSFQELAFPKEYDLIMFTVGKFLIFVYFTVVFLLMATPAWEYVERGEL